MAVVISISGATYAGIQSYRTAHHDAVKLNADLAAKIAKNAKEHAVDDIKEQGQAAYAAYDKHYKFWNKCLYVPSILFIVLAYGAAATICVICSHHLLTTPDSQPASPTPPAPAGSPPAADPNATTGTTPAAPANQEEKSPPPVNPRIDSILFGRTGCWISIAAIAVLLVVDAIWLWSVRNCLLKMNIAIEKLEGLQGIIDGLLASEKRDMDAAIVGE